MSYGDGGDSTTWDDITVWLDAGLPFHTASTPVPGHPAPASSSSSSFAPRSDAYVLFVDDLEALEALAPSARAARRFMSTVLNHLAPAAADASSGGAERHRRHVLTVVAHGRQDPYSARSRKQQQYGSGGGARGGTAITTFASGFGENIFSPAVCRAPYTAPGTGTTTGTVGQDWNLCCRNICATGAFAASIQAQIFHSRVNAVGPSVPFPCNRADATVCIQPLASGYSSEVHGIITIAVSSPLQGAAAGGDPGRASVRPSTAAAAAAGPLVLHYKALDSGIRCTVSTSITK